MSPTSRSRFSRRGCARHMQGQVSECHIVGER
ncbi:hypothetical protein CO2235_140091 [Cupriavidus oxalaticus]|uniref:Uncharacterized protein n=1 Tax=Cupriavidus oxalaticus TaxID=96344 RepID=A0A976G954_9BURK|nr:hypothetical protein CO2235_140091 [Cupriavidus oxalaticus]